MDLFTLLATLSAPPETVYTAWLNGKQHGAFTGGKATVDARVGGALTAWDGYITGTTVELEPSHRIVQRWRTTEFPAGSPDSLLEITLRPVATGTELTLVHTEIPDGQGKQ